MQNLPAPRDKCQEGLDSFRERKRAFQSATLRELRVTKDHTLHRLIRENEIEPDTGRPKFKIFNDATLSLEVEGPEFPELDLRNLIREKNRDLDPGKPKFVGAYLTSLEILTAPIYRTHHDPFPDSQGRQQTPNHAQIFCKKGNPVAREIVENGDWSLRPPDLEADS